MDLKRGVIDDLVRQCWEIADDKGWHEPAKSIPEAIALMHSELSEALEAVRIGNPRSGKIGPDFDQFTEELADCVIRIFDECHQEGKDIGGAILAKMAYNRTRPHRHGGKLY